MYMVIVFKVYNMMMYMYILKDTYMYCMYMFVYVLQMYKVHVLYNVHSCTCTYQIFVEYFGLFGVF